MSDEMISRERASTVRLVCQSAAAVFIAGAVLVAVLGSPFGSPPAVSDVAYEDVAARAQEMTEASGEKGDQGEDEESFPVDVEAIEYSLMLPSNAPKPKEDDSAEPEGPEVAETPTDPGEADGRTRFLGTVRVGGRYLALLSAGGAQRILGEGDRRTLPLMPGDQQDPPEVTVHEVTADAVRLTENGVERRVERAARVGIAVSQSAAPVSPSQGNAAGRASDRFAGDRSSARPGSDGVDDKPINPDDYRREDGTIDYEALRSAARERARARRDRYNQNEENGDEN